MDKAIKFLKHANWSARLGLAVIVINVVCALFAPWVAPYGETEIVGDVWEPVMWSAEAVPHDPPVILGTDQLGRDLFSRLMYGARNTIAVALVTTALSFGVGALLGFLAATMKGWVDTLLSRVTDILMAFPTLIFALVVLSVMGTSTTVLIVVIALIDATRVYRISRAVAMDIEVMEYVESARLRGEGLWWVMKDEILPNALSPLVAEFGLRFCFVFLFISALSFLGLGLQPPTADWGSMVRENAAAISFGILTPLIPAGAIALLTVGLNLVVDWFLHKASGIKDLP
ncbi:ABC transporter permease [Mesorhizobium sp.]|uniref:ABC transporter permease n=1 Tax=Mesorhizobium sp. TaxID=1871066 RepID=UPI0025C18AD2|nr:ABC transporter permease [Mesorhizobium sp.]